MRINRRLITHSRQNQLQLATKALLIIQDAFISIGDLLSEALIDSSLFQEDDPCAGNKMKSYSFESWSEN